MRLALITLIALAVTGVAGLAAPSEAVAQAREEQQRQRDDATGETARRLAEQFNPTTRRLAGRINAGPCPIVRILYDAARYVEFVNGEPSSSAVGYTGEIEEVAADCAYRETDPISVDMDVLFHLGRGPQTDSANRTYRYWVAVTERNGAVLAKEYFALPVNFGAGDRVYVTEEFRNVVIPRANATTSGANFEILIGFDVTPEMAEFNRTGSRFRIDAGAAGQP